MSERLVIIVALFFGLGLGVGWHKFRVRLSEKTCAGKVDKINGLKEQVLSILKNRRRGCSLVELGRIMDTHFLKLTYPIKRLMEEGLVKKEKDNYVLA